MAAPPIVSMAIGHHASRGMVVVALPSHSGGSLDVCRRLKLEACVTADLRHYLDEFWPAERRAVFQPEPGCSDATFIGSEADVAGLAALMLNLAAADLRRASRQRERDRPLHRPTQRGGGAETRELFLDARPCQLRRSCELHGAHRAGGVG